MKRYVPELQSLTAKILASEVRKMNFKDRYYFLKNIPEIYREYILAYPTNFISWLAINNLLNLKDYKEYKEDIDKEYKEDCDKGYIFSKIILRHCSNIYCENLSHGRMILTTKINLCSECHFPLGIWVKLKNEIIKFN